MINLKFLFDKPLVKGMIKARPNRFIMKVELNGNIYDCHCPVTGKIGNIVFKDIPCLLSESLNPNRKTNYTVEAISIDDGKSWIGLNQNKTNRIIEFLLKTNQLSMIFDNISSVRREVKLHNSKIDFLVNEQYYVEVKTLLRDLNIDYSNVLDNKKNSGIFYERLIRHMDDITRDLTEASRAIMILCFTYNAKEFVPPYGGGYSNEIFQASSRARERGLENWQVNLKFDEFGVDLIKYFKLNNI